MNLRIETIVIPSGFDNALAVRITPPDSHARPLYFHGGYGVDNVTYMAYIARKYSREVFTILYMCPRKRDVFYHLLSPQGDTHKRVHRRTVRRLGSRISQPIIAESQIHFAKDILAAMDAIGLQCIDAIGQSAGAMRVLEFARQAPKRLNGIVLPYPAGIIKVDRRQLLRKAKNLTRNSMKARRAKRENNILDYLGTFSHNLHPPKDMYATGENILLSHHGMPTALWGKEEMPKIAVIAGLEDDLFSPDRIQKYLYPGTPLYIVSGLHGFRGRQSIVDFTIDTLDSLKAP